MSAWVNDYVGIPYRPNGRDRSGLDCWGLLVLVFREQRGIELPDWQAPVYEGHFASLLSTVRAASAHWGEVPVERIDAPEPWAIVISERKLRPHHAGICVGDSYVLHAGELGVVCPRAHQFNALYGERSYWRWLH